MMIYLFLLFVLGSLPLFASAHGFCKTVIIDGVSYSGNLPAGVTNPSVIRQVSTINPIKGADNQSMYCGINSTLASDVASANPGSQVQVAWAGDAAGVANWPHTIGPIMHYMTKCNGSCASYDTANTEWFKIAEAGVQPDNTTWYQANMQAGYPANATIPSNITAGGYLLRAELISLQHAETQGGAEFYVACIQLDIGGSGTGAPTSNEECTFPGCYSNTDPGIFDPTIFDTPITNYTFPGPPVASFATDNTAGQNGTQPSGSTGGSSATLPTSSSSPSPSASASGGQRRSLAWWQVYLGFVPLLFYLPYDM